jgi:hypothetical protein
MNELEFELEDFNWLQFFLAVDFNLGFGRRISQLTVRVLAMS